MNDMSFEPASFDAIWSEGAIYFMGFEQGLAKVKELQKQGRWSDETLMFSAVEETATEAATTSNDVIAFPQAGKRIEDCAPRMRFAPSPTGR